MEEGKLLEVRMQLEREEQILIIWQKNEIEQVLQTISFNMSWNKRSSSNRYNSFSGHAFIVGCLSGKIIAGTVTTKNCRFYFSHEIKRNEPPLHNFPKSYTGLSKVMEVDAELSLYQRFILNPIRKCLFKILFQMMIQQ